MKPLIYMAIGAMIPLACMEIKKSNGFEKFVQDIGTKLQKIQDALKETSSNDEEKMPQ